MHGCQCVLRILLETWSRGDSTKVPAVRVPVQCTATRLGGPLHFPFVAHSGGPAVRGQRPSSPCDNLSSAWSGGRRPPPYWRLRVTGMGKRSFTQSASGEFILGNSPHSNSKHYVFLQRFIEPQSYSLFTSFYFSGLGRPGATARQASTTTTRIGGPWSSPARS